MAQPYQLIFCRPVGFSWPTGYRPFLSGSRRKTQKILCSLAPPSAASPLWAWPGRARRERGVAGVCVWGAQSLESLMWADEAAQVCCGLGHSGPSSAAPPTFTRRLLAASRWWCSFQSSRSGGTGPAVSRSWCLPGHCRHSSAGGCPLRGVGTGQKLCAALSRWAVLDSTS